MKTKIILTTALVCSFFIGLAAITGLNGKWAGTVKVSDDNELELVYNFRVNGDKLTGNVESPQGTLPIVDGELSGKDLAFKIKVGKITVFHTGKYYGDSVVVSADLNGEAYHSTLKRVNN